MSATLKRLAEDREWRAEQEEADRRLQDEQAQEAAAA